MISFKQFLNEALSVSNTHYKKYFDLVQSYVGANKRKEIVNGNDIKIIFLNGSKEIVTLNYEGDGRKLELKSFIKDNKETNIDKEIRDTKSIRDLIGTPLDFYFSNDKSNDSKTKKYKPKTKKELKELCDDLSIHLGDIDTSLITDMSGLFCFNKRTDKQFEGIEDWDVSNVTNMEDMFCRSNYFNRDIGKWDVSKVTNMRSMFDCCHNFNKNIGKWDVSKVTDMYGMFSVCYDFNQPLNNWDVSNVIDMRWMFINCHAFNQPLDKWNVSNVTKVEGMFKSAKSFNQNISKWNIKRARNTSGVFDGCPIEDDYKPKFN